MRTLIYNYEEESVIVYHYYDKNKEFIIPSLPKIAAFDFDWTLVKPQNDREFPKNVDDWMWRYPTVPEIVKKYYADGYIIAIFTNQSKEYKQKQIMTALKTLQIPFYACVATDKSSYKPNPIMWEIFLEDHLEVPRVHTDSFFVGDALDAKKDFSDSDYKFAIAIGLCALSPESIFVTATSMETIKESIIARVPKVPQHELIILVGYPGAGKSTIAQIICEREPSKYEILSYDNRMTEKKIIKILETEMKEHKKSFIIDNTNPSYEKRQNYINIADANNYLTRIIHANASLETANNQNKMRTETKVVPKIAMWGYRKRFEEVSLHNKPVIKIDSF